MIEKKLERNIKFTEEMISSFQMDNLDVQAREVVGPIVRIATENVDLLLKDQKADALEVISHLQRWRGIFSIDNVGATVYSAW
mmetsp:Transcript_12652/g.12477  ORF Transcript_12652/g.12477 Transcript_12652/m.12477 type:complete len:83 (-) Transcript_12652:760-1008(-)